MNLKIEPNHYFNKTYDSKGRFCSYWHQINEIISLNPQSILEIGIGNAFVSNYIKDRGFRITTIDIDKWLKPDIVGTVLYIPFKDHSFEVIACYEVLEHLSYEDFHKSLTEIFRVCKLYAILSLPNISRTYRFNIQIPKYREIKKLIRLPRFKKPIHNFNGEHYWEIGKDGYPLKKIISDIRKSGFKIQKTYQVFEMPYHRFFVLKV